MPIRAGIKERLCGLFVVLIVGCEDQYFRAETMWHADASLRDVMQHCLAAGSLKPFDEYEREIKNSGDEDPVVLARIKSLRQLLTAPGKPR